LLAHGRWFSAGTPASSTTKTGHHDIAESGVKHQKSKKIIIKSSINLYKKTTTFNLYKKNPTLRSISTSSNTLDKNVRRTK
jgi:hypothetical protein